MDLITYNNLQEYFVKKLEPLKCESFTKAYIVGILSKYKNAQFDYSNQSITIIYSEAKTKLDFEKFQNLGDWIFVSNVIFP